MIESEETEGIESLKLTLQKKYRFKNTKLFLK